MHPLTAIGRFCSRNTAISITASPSPRPLSREGEFTRTVRNYGRDGGEQVYNYWVAKRSRLRRPLLRHLAPHERVEPEPPAGVPPAGQGEEAPAQEKAERHGGVQEDEAAKGGLREGGEAL